MRKKISILIGFTFLILLLLPGIIVISININEKQIKEDSVAILKTSSWKEGFNYSMNLNAVYNWIEINETGTLMEYVSGKDDDSQSINITAEDGWEFTFYGRKYTNITVNSNGWMTCSYEGDTTNYDFTGKPTSYVLDSIPQNCSVSGYENHNDSILVFATDLWPGAEAKGRIYYEFRGNPSNRHLVIEFDQVREVQTPAYQTFQAIFYKNGDIKFQYKKTTFDPFFNEPDIRAGLDHGDLINYNSISSDLLDFTKGVKEKAVYFSLNPVPPIPLPTPDDDDDDDDETYLTLLIVLIVVFVSIGAGVAIIYILIKKGKKGSSR